MRHRLVFLVCVAAVCIGAALAIVTRTTSAQKSNEDRPFANLRALSKSAKQGFDRRRARDVGYELARNSFPVTAMLPPGVPDAMMRRFADMIGDRQLAWQQRRGRGGIHEEALLDALNRHLELDTVPEEHLRIRPRDLRRVRTQVWVQISELSTGVERAHVRTGTKLTGPRMSPFEAFLVADLLLYQKALNPSFVRTASEERTKLKEGPSVPRRTPGLFAPEPNLRGERFEAHLHALAKAKWQSPDAVLQTVADILDESER